MAKDKINFPSRAKRRQLIEQLRKSGQNPQIGADENFAKYVQAIEAMDNKMEELSREDENGIPKNLTKEEADELSGLIVKAAELGETYLSFEGINNARVTAGVPGMVNKLQSMLQKDFEALDVYDPAQPKSLPEIQESSRTTTIDLRGHSLNTLTNLQNERIPIAVVNGKGQKRNGVFTKLKRVEAKTRFDKIIADAKAKCKTDEQRAELDKIFASYRDKRIGSKMRNGGRIKADTSDTYLVGDMSKQLYGKKEKKPMTASDTKEFLRQYTDINVNLLPKAALNSLAGGLTGIKNDLGLEINTTRLELSEGARLDNRNSAMSSVASLLGCSKVVAKSENMKFIGEDGQETEGTFMEYADGVDLYRDESLFRHAAVNPFGDPQKRNSLYKQIADLQVMDFLCTNEDRHPGNVFYDLDKDGHIKGIQAIDNDSTFASGDTKTIKVSDLRVISKSMKEKVMKLTPQMLRFSLRGHGLSEEELFKAQTNLSELQNAIKYNEIEVVDDDKFASRSINSLVPRNQKRTNLFKDIDDYVLKKVREYRDPNHPREPIPDQPDPDLPEVYTTSRRRTVGGLTDSLSSVSRKVFNKENSFNVDDLTTKMRGSSQHFKDMVNAAKDADTLLRQLKENKNIDMTKLATEDPETLAKVNDAFSKIDDMTDTYLMYKIGQRGSKDENSIKAKNEYEQKHIDYARDLKKLAAEYRKTMGLAESDSDKEELTSNMQRRELENRRAEAAKKEGGPML